MAKEIGLMGQGSVDAPDATLWVLHEVMFPDAYNAPAQLPQFSIDKHVTRFVGVEFLSPEWSVVGWHVLLSVVFPKMVSLLIHNRPIWKDVYFNHVFFYCHRVLKAPFSR